MTFPWKYTWVWKLRGNGLTKCTAFCFTQNVWIMGWIFFFFPNPQGHGFVLWVFSEIFWALRLLGFENCVTCQGWLLPLHLMCPASHHAHEGVVIREKQILKEWKKWGQEQEVVGVFSLPLWLFCFSLFFSSFPFTLSGVHFFLILSLFPFTFFSYSLKAEGWVKIRILIRESLQEAGGRNYCSLISFLQSYPL